MKRSVKRMLDGHPTEVRRTVGGFTELGREAWFYVSGQHVDLVVEFLDKHQRVRCAWVVLREQHLADALAAIRANKRKRKQTMKKRAGARAARHASGDTR